MTRMVVTPSKDSRHRKPHSRFSAVRNWEIQVIPTLCLQPAYEKPYPHDSPFDLKSSLNDDLETSDQQSDSDSDQSFYSYSARLDAFADATSSEDPRDEKEFPNSAHMSDPSKSPLESETSTTSYEGKRNDIQSIYSVDRNSGRDTEFFTSNRFPDEVSKEGPLSQRDPVSLKALPSLVKDASVQTSPITNPTFPYFCSICRRVQFPPENVAESEIRLSPQSIRPSFIKEQYTPCVLLVNVQKYQILSAYSRSMDR